jgi:hypothetical protein
VSSNEETALRAQVYALAAKLVPEDGTFKSRRLALARNGSPKAPYRAVIGIAWTVRRVKEPRVDFVHSTDHAYDTPTRESALAALVAALRKRVTPRARRRSGTRRRAARST